MMKKRNNMKNNKVVLAYSGGLDTSFCLKKLIDEGFDVYPILINTGGFTKSDLKSHNNRNLGIIARKEKFLKKFEKNFEIIESRVKSENLKIGIKY